MQKKWEYLKNNKKEIEKLVQKYNINELLATVLANRGITTENADVFLNPTRKDFYNPFEMPDMEKAIKRIIQAKEKNEKVIIYGDYDVDGITSITVLKSFLAEIGIETSQYIPNRINEGYGLNKNAIEKISEEKFTLMITVDCGITSIQEIEYAKDLGIETIITDHHEPGQDIPKAVAVIDCKRKDNKYPFRELAGVGVVFKLIQALGKTLNVKEEQYLKYLDIVALGTISDIVPLIDENRIITKLGLMLIAQTRNYGLKALLNISGYNQINSTTISFGIAPKINACGRMGYADDALKLLLSQDINEAMEQAQNILKYNNDRQKYEKIIFDDAVNQIEEKQDKIKSSIVLGGLNWHNGVIGIVASKIVEIYYKPCILISFNEESEIGKGSGRSISGFDLHKALMECEDILEGFGGHSMAIGLSVKKENLDKLKEKFEKIAQKENVQNLNPVVNIDSVVNIEHITKEVVKSLSLLEPLGEANKMPIFVFKNLKINSIRALSEGKHLKLTLKTSKNTYIDAIGFNLGNLSNEYIIGDKVDVAGSLEISNFNGNEFIQINIKDIMKSL